MLIGALEEWKRLQVAKLKTGKFPVDRHETSCVPNKELLNFPNMYENVSLHNQLKGSGH